EILANALDLKSEGRGEVFFVADHHVDVRCQFAIDLRRACLAADRLPQRVTVVEVIADDGAVLARCDHRFFRNFGLRLAQRAEDTAGMEPPRTFPAEDRVPVDLTRLQLAYSRVSTVVAAQCRTNSKPALGEVQAIASSHADAVILYPRDMRLVYAALEQQIFEQSSHRVVSQRSDDGGLQPEASPQSASDVVLSAALPHVELARCGNTQVAGVEPQHDFTEAHLVPLALVFRSDDDIVRTTRSLGHRNLPFQTLISRLRLCSSVKAVLRKCSPR